MLDKAENYAELAKDKISEFSQEAGDALGKTIDTIKENAEITKDKINHLAEEAKELARDKISSLTQKENPEEAQNKIGE